MRASTSLSWTVYGICIGYRYSGIRRCDLEVSEGICKGEDWKGNVSREEGRLSRERSESSRLFLMDRG